MRGLIASLILVLGSCVSVEEPVAPPPVGSTGYFDAQKSACEGRGGTWGGTGSGTFVCFTTPSDAGKLCSASTDCSTQCLARSKTCAPVAPLLGCQQILNRMGAQITLCNG